MTLSTRVPLASLLIALSLLSPVANAESPPDVPVVLSISTNTAVITGFNDIRIHRNLPPNHNEGMFAKENFTVLRATRGMARDTALFVASLPPGEYNFSLFSSAQGKTLSVGENNLLGKFVVTAGMPVDLGRLLLTPFNQKVLIGRAAHSTSNAELLRIALPEKAAQFSGTTSQGWIEPMTEDAQSLERHALASTVGADCATESADGTVYAASRLGTVLIRSPKGVWRSVHGQRLESLLCVLPVNLPDTELVAVGEFGTMMRKPRGQDVLVSINPGNLPLGDLDGIEGSEAAGWFVRHRRGNNVTLFRSPTLEAGNWTPVFKNDADVNASHRRESMFLWHTPSGMGYAGAQGPVKSFDQATGQWSDMTLPANFKRVMNVVAATNGDLSLQAASDSFIMIETAFVSRDNGRNWNKVPTRVVNLAPQMKIFHDGTLMMRNANGGMLETSKDDGASWTIAGTLPNGGTILPLRSGALLNMVTSPYGWFTIDVSQNHGGTWSQEYSTFNSRFYQAQQKKN